MNNNEISNKAKSKGLLAHIIALVVVMIWGGTFVNTRVLIDRGLLPEEIYVLRTLLGYICIWSISPKKLFCDTLKRRIYNGVIASLVVRFTFLQKTML